MAEAAEKDNIKFTEKTVSADEQNAQKENEVEQVHVMDEETGEAVEFSIKSEKSNKNANDINEVNVKATLSSQDYYMAHVNYIFYRRGIIRLSLYNRFIDIHRSRLLFFSISICTFKCMFTFKNVGKRQIFSKLPI